MATILCDLDDTLVDLMGKSIYYYNDKHGTNLTLNDFTEWDLPDRERWVDIWRIPDFFGGLRPFPGAIEALSLLKHMGHKVVLVSAYPTWESARSKVAWVHTWLRIPGVIDSMDQLVLTRGKHRIMGDIIVDDKIDNLERHPTAFPICFAQPWNTQYVGCRVNNWSEVVAQINKHCLYPARAVGGCY